MQLFDVPGNGRLGRLESAGPQLRQKLILCINILFLNNAQNLLLTFSLHALAPPSF